jgi:hypothetical protein
LNSKDAALFVYKKSIFDTLDEMKNKHKEHEANQKIKNVSIMMDIYNKLTETEITYFNSEDLKNKETINNLYFDLEGINTKLFKLYSYCLNRINLDESKTINEGDNIFYNKIIYIKTFCDILVLKKVYNLSINETDIVVDGYKDYIKTIEYFIKKIRKINSLPVNFELHLISKSFTEQFEKKIKSYNSSKFVNWIFT